MFTPKLAILLLSLAAFEPTIVEASPLSAPIGRHAPPYLASKIGGHKRAIAAWWKKEKSLDKKAEGDEIPVVTEVQAEGSYYGASHGLVSDPSWVCMVRGSWLTRCIVSLRSSLLVRNPSTMATHTDSSLPGPSSTPPSKPNTTNSPPVPSPKPCLLAGLTRDVSKNPTDRGCCRVSPFLPDRPASSPVLVSVGRWGTSTRGLSTRTR